MNTPPFKEPIAEHLWHSRYQWVEGGRLPEPAISATWDRVALAVSGVETHNRDEWRERFRSILSDFRFLPGGRILAAAGTTRHATLMSCYAAGLMEDSLQGIFNGLREAMLTLQAGGGLGVDFSTLRPAGSLATSSGAMASGPISFMKIWEKSCAVLASGNPGRGVALRATLRCDHPDIESFLDLKKTRGALPHFKLSVAVTDAFMQAVEEDGPWPLVFPLGQHPVPTGGEVCERIWPGGMTPQLCLVHRRVPARALWEQLIEAQLAHAEPSVLFVDRMNGANNLWYREQILTASPGAEAPLPPYGACNLGAINLTRFVQHAFGEHPSLNFADLKAVAAIATRFLDNVHDLSLHPLKAQEKAALASRRLGLGVTGLADMLLMLGLSYGSQSSLDLVREIMGVIRDTAYRVSIELAKEKSAFPGFDKTRYAGSSFVLDLPHDIQDAIAQHGIRNSHLLAVAPSQSVSLLANNVSSGIEPIRGLRMSRTATGADGQGVAFEVEDAALRHYKSIYGQEATVPELFNTATDVTAEDQLRMMSVVQSCVDSAIPHPVRLPKNATAQEVGLVLRQAWELGLKGCSAHLTISTGTSA